MLRKLNIVALLAAIMALGIFAPSASAYCGPGFHSKSEYISFYKSPEGKPYAKGVERFLNAHKKYYHYHADQGLINYLEQPNVEYFKAPKGYHIEKNTWCPNAGSFLNYPGRFNVSNIGMLWYCAEKGEEGHHGHNCVPIAKGYCRNLTIGKKIRKRHPHKPKCKCHHHKHHPKCGCHHHHKPKKPEPGGTCNGNNVNNGTGSAGNCNICTGVNVCNEQPPPPPPTPEPPKIKNVYNIQEARAGEMGINFYADVFAPVGDEVVLTFESETGWFTPYKFTIPSYGSQSHFETAYNASSEPGFDNVCVTALDKTTGKEATPQCQLVEVQAVGEPPS